NIHLLVRAKTQQEAFDRINKKFQFYFNQPLEQASKKRVVVIKADLEENSFGLSIKDYQHLTKKIDSIIHAAASVKHYDDGEKLYSANVLATTNLLEFSKLTRLKDFHYISTCSIFDFKTDSDANEIIYTEMDLPSNLAKWNNIYNKTKFQGEQKVM